VHGARYRPAQQRDRRIEPLAGGVEEHDERRAESAEPHTLEQQVDHVRAEHGDGGCGPCTGPHGNRRPFAVCEEQALEALVRPAPQVVRVRVERVDAVCREEHPASGPHDASQLPHRRRRIRYVLEHLEAEHDVEAAAVHGNRID